MFINYTDPTPKGSESGQSTVMFDVGLVTAAVLVGLFGVGFNWIRKKLNLLQQQQQKHQQQVKLRLDRIDGRLGLHSSNDQDLTIEIPKNNHTTSQRITNLSRTRRFP
ncbi:hypothetical protein RLOatenuis_2440 [Rickettsiales bacterium]|nr:hypothetical protein RLOatenuis_2440 [Rickettsiales bacterium]